MQLIDFLQGTKLASLVRGLNTQQRITMGGVVLLSLVALGGVLHWATRDEYVPLSSALELSQVESVAATLEGAGIPYRLGGGGTTLLVPEKHLAKARVRLASEGLPAKGRPGFELFDARDWGATSFGEQVKYQRALKGELESTISDFNGVREASVHFTTPKQSPFRKERRDAEASVLLKLEAGRTLSKETVQAIVYLVSSSIEWLSPDNVTVLDDSGRVLSSPTDNSLSALGNRQLELQREVERHLEEKVSALLSSIVGAPNVRVASSVQLNFDQIERAMEQFDPAGAVILSEQTSAVVPGANQNAAVLVAPGTSTETRNYNNSHSVERVTAAIGSIEHLTVSVLINDRMVPTDSGFVFEPRSEQDLANIEALVRDAVGALDERGDRVTVTNVRFDGDPTLNLHAGATLYETLEPWFKPMTIALILGLSFILVLKFLDLLRQDRSAEEDAAPVVEEVVEEGEEQPEEEPAEPEVVIPPTAMLEIKEPAVVKETEGLVRSNPELAVRLFRSWLKEG